MPVVLDDVRRLAVGVLAPAHFFVAPDLDLEWGQREREETAWELFRGRLLDPAHTRERAVFETWDVWERTPEGRASEPVLSIKLDATAGVVHVVRGLECYVWEGYDSGGGVILSRERRKWVRELVVTLRLADIDDVDEFRSELTYGLYSAVVGTSRLPLTSVEAPLPSFSFGRLFYCPRDERSPGTLASSTWRDLLAHPIAMRVIPLAQPHWMEVFLHAVPHDDLTEAARDLMDQHFTAIQPEPADAIHLIRQLFNEVSLSPWTDLTEKALGLLRAFRSENLLGEEGTTDCCQRSQGDELILDCLAHLLRQTTRHLTAYDLVTFHHRGANYPDALLLDLVLKEYLTWIERRPDQLSDETSDDEPRRRAKRRRRRALRQAWLVRRRYEGHPVPDAPTSPGENNRVLPTSHPRVPEEQILQTSQRRRKLYEGDSLTNHLGSRALFLLRESVRDLQDEAELRELGTALFLDRPLSHGKAPGESDATPLLASIAFSRAVAIQRVRALGDEDCLTECRPILDGCLQMLTTLRPHGLALDHIGGASRPGVVSLADARLASPDFEFLWTTNGAFWLLIQVFDFKPLEERYGDPLAQVGGPLLVRAPQGPFLHLYDWEKRLRMVLEVDLHQGYVCRLGVEFPRAGLLGAQLWIEATDGSLREETLNGPIRISPRSDARLNTFLVLRCYDI